MPDIFGRTAESYGLVRDLREAGNWDLYQQREAVLRPESSGVHDFDAYIPRVSRYAAVSDAQAIGYLTNNLLSLQTFVDDTLYTRFRLPEMIQINDTVPPGSKFYGYRITDRRGKAKRISAHGDDAGTAIVSETILQHPIHYYGIDAIWTIAELRGALLAGTALDTEALDAAVEGMLNSMEELAFVGDEDNKGLFNLPTAGTEAVTNQVSGALWSAMTAAQIRTQINGELTGLIETSNETIRAFNNATIYLSGPRYDYLTDVYIGDNAERTLMTSIMEDNPFSIFTGQPVSFRRVLELKNQGVGETHRMVVTMRHNRIVEMPVALSPRIVKIMDNGREQCAQVEAEFGPIWPRRSSLIRYTDTI